jgi:uncharacterized protein (DUF1778 family)
MPTHSIIAKEDRLSIRIPRSIKEDLVRAAAISGVTLGDFVIANSATAAVNIIKSHQLIQLSTRDYDLLMNALDNPPNPNKALLKAAKDYKEAVTQGDLTVEDS